MSKYDALRKYVKIVDGEFTCIVSSMPRPAVKASSVNPSLAN